MDRDELLSVSKPTRYLGHEMNSVQKNLEEVRLRFALAFPDVYEVGMSYLGLQILYHILNRQPEIACERVFAPWPDMENLLRQRSQSITTLESRRPLKDFDVLGFSLLYELNYTGVLNILDLAQIPIRSSARTASDPLIIGGGPCTMNPEPLADFFDAFVLGDGEEVILDICREIIVSKEKKESKKDLLERLSHLEGVYIPSFFEVEYGSDGRIQKMIPRKKDSPRIRRRVLSDLNPAGFPSHPIVPFLETIHDRLNIEIARGCTRGCRFCQAGFIYRPLRERTPQKILALVEEGLKNTGYDEISLLSLSTGDYSCIEPLVSQLIHQHGGKQVAVALPSLRTETLTSSLIQNIRHVRKTGFTLAPEAGSERMRQVINKGNSEEDLLKTIERAFDAGWQLIKLYFMIGLPTETAEDVQGIGRLCRKALEVARRSKGSVQINVSVSSFIPKAHTPFQWEPQSTVEEIQRKQAFLRPQLQRRGIHYKWVDPHLSLLEGVFSRGDRRLARVLELAYALGCRLDGWGDHFRFDRWEKAFRQAGLEPSFYAHRKREEQEILPWDHLDSRVTKAFLWEERNRAFQGLPTPDCRKAPCNHCGVCLGSPSMKNQIAKAEEVSPLPALIGSQGERNFRPEMYRYRCQFSKMNLARYLSHLELSRALIRTLRRAEIPLAFSQGFHPQPKVSFGPPLPVGYESLAEFFDIYTQAPMEIDALKAKINQRLPLGIQILGIKEIPLKSPSIFDSIIHILYIIRFSGSFRVDRELIDRFWEKESFFVLWPRKNKIIDLRRSVKSLSILGDQALKLDLWVSKEDYIKPEEVLALILDWKDERPDFSICKCQMGFPNDP